MFTGKNVVGELYALYRIVVLLGFVVLLNGCMHVSQPQNESPVAAVSQPSVKKTKTPDMEALAAKIDFNAAMKAIESGNYNKGIELLQKVTARSKSNTTPYINLAMAYMQTGNLKLAEENFKLALTIDPGHPVANSEYALLYRKTGRFIEARSLYEQTLEKYPTYYRTHKNLGILCDLYMRDYVCALKHYEIYSRAVPEDKAVKIWIADIQSRVSRQEEI